MTTSSSARSDQVSNSVWIAVRASLREVLEYVTVTHLLAKELPGAAVERTRSEDAWHRR